jgi:hypothetical protein
VGTEMVSGTGLSQQAAAHACDVPPCRPLCKVLNFTLHAIELNIEGQGRGWKWDIDTDQWLGDPIEDVQYCNGARWHRCGA